MAECKLCIHHCDIKEGMRGRCLARVCRDGKIVPENYGCITSIALDPIEKKPLAHFNPGSRILSVGSYGCNLSCPFCQNHEISHPADLSYLKRMSRTIMPQELTQLEEQQAKLRIAYESAFNMAEIEDYAIHALGMQKPRADQIYYIDTSSPDKAVVFAGGENAGFVDRVSDYLSGLIEYFR